MLVAALIIGCGGPESNSTNGVGTPQSGPQAAGAAERPDAAAAASKVLFIGTSLTAGLGLSEAQSFPLLIERRIEQAGLPFDVVNAGVSGETSAGALSRIGWLLRQDFSVVVLETGANDMLRGIDPASTERNIQAIIDQIRAARRDAQIVLVGLAHADRARLAPERQRMTQPRGDPLQHREIEVDRIPAGQHVGVERGDPRAKRVERFALIRARGRALGHRPRGAVDDQHLVERAAVRVDRDREQRRAARIRLDVEGQHPRLERDLRGGHRRVIENPGHAVAPDSRPLYLAAALDPSLDEVADREAHIRLEGLDTGLMQALAQRRDVGRDRHLDAGDRLAAERAALRDLRVRRAERAGARRVARAQIEERPLAVVPHQEGAAARQRPVEMDDGHGAVRAVTAHPISRLQDETAYLHRPIMLDRARRGPRIGRPARTARANPPGRGCAP